MIIIILVLGLDAKEVVKIIWFKKKMVTLSYYQCY